MRRGAIFLFKLSTRAAVLMALIIQHLPARHLPIQVYTAAQGLPRNSVGCMLPSPDGLLWLCTMGGLARFDGYHFRVFGPEQGLPSRNILDMTGRRVTAGIVSC